MPEMTTQSERRGSPLRIFRCERCRKPCMLTRLDKEEMKYCPADSTPVDWKLITKDESFA